MFCGGTWHWNVFQLGGFAPTKEVHDQLIKSYFLARKSLSNQMEIRAMVIWTTVLLTLCRIQVMFHFSQRYVPLYR